MKWNNYYSEILKVCCDAKKTFAFEENFWEKNDGVYTYFNEMKDFLFNLQEMDLVFKNILIGVLFFVLVEIYFGLDKNKFQIWVINFCFGHYFGKKRPPQLYVKINDCIFRLKEWTH